jgi:hypothetical protein
VDDFETRAFLLRFLFVFFIPRASSGTAGLLPSFLSRWAPGGPGLPGSSPFFSRHTAGMIRLFLHQGRRATVTGITLDGRTFVQLCCISRASRADFCPSCLNRQTFSQSLLSTFFLGPSSDLGLTANPRLDVKGIASRFAVICICPSRRIEQEIVFVHLGELLETWDDFVLR